MMLLCLHLVFACLVFGVLFISLMIRFNNDLSQQFFKTMKIYADESHIGETDPFSKIFDQLLSELFIRLYLTSNYQKLYAKVHLHSPSPSYNLIDK